MADFISEDLTGSRFEDVYLTGARFRDADLTNARFHLVDLTGVMIRGAVLVNVDISGEIKNMRVNGVDVVPLVAAELNRRYPDRAKMRPADADGFREAWDILERLWQQTVGRARGMAPELPHERVEGEWSFIETLRHLVFATDAWVKRAILGEPSPWDPLDLPHDEIPDEPSVPRDRGGARPSLDQVLALRSDRMATVRQVIADLTRRQAGRHDRTSHRAGLPRTGELRRTPLPAGHPQRGVGAQAVRRKGPPHARVPVALTPGAASALTRPGTPCSSSAIPTGRRSAGWSRILGTSRSRTCAAAPDQP